MALWTARHALVPASAAKVENFRKRLWSALKSR